MECRRISHREPDAGERQATNPSHGWHAPVAVAGSHAEAGHDPDDNRHNDEDKHQDRDTDAGTHQTIIGRQDAASIERLLVDGIAAAAGKTLFRPVYRRIACLSWSSGRGNCSILSL